MKLKLHLGVIVLCSIGCGDPESFIVQPWPATDLAIGVWADTTGDTVRLGQAAAGEPLRVEIPESDGRLYVRTFAPDLRLGQQPLSACSAQVGGEGLAYPPPSTLWSSPVVRGPPDQLTPEDLPARDFDLRSPDCAAALPDPCEQVSFEQLPVPEDLDPLSVTVVGPEHFFVSGRSEMDVPSQAKLFEYRDGAFTELPINRNGTELTHLRRYGTDALYGILQPGGRLVRMGFAGDAQIIETTLAGVFGNPDRLLSFNDNGIIEIDDSVAEGYVAVPPIPEALDWAAVFGDNQIAALGKPNVFIRRNDQWFIDNPNSVLANRLRLMGGSFRLFIVGAGGTLLVYEGVSWTVDLRFTVVGAGRLRTAADVGPDSYVVGGDRIVAMKTAAGWCAFEDSTYRYGDIQQLSPGAAIAVSRSEEGTRALITRIYH